MANAKLALLLLLSAPAAAAPWIPLGPTFAADAAQPDHAFRFGFDKSATAGVCAEWNIVDRRPEAGPCRDVFLLRRGDVVAAHLGGSLMFALDDAAHTRPAYGTRLGINTGPAAKQALAAIGAHIPYLDQLGAYKAPAWASYLGAISSLDFSGSWRPKPRDGGHRWLYGVQLKVDIPLEDLLSLLRGAP